MNVPAVHFKVLEKYLEIGVMVKEGFAFGIGDEDGEDAVKVVGLDEASVIAKKSEFLVEFELMTDYGFEVAHDLILLYVRFPCGNKSLTRCCFV